MGLLIALATTAGDLRAKAFLLDLQFYWLLKKGRRVAVWVMCFACVFAELSRAILVAATTSVPPVLRA